MKIIVYDERRVGGKYDLTNDGGLHIGSGILHKRELFEINEYAGIMPSENEIDEVYGDLFIIGEDLYEKLKKIYELHNYTEVIDEIDVNGTLHSGVTYFMRPQIVRNYIESGDWFNR